jgi:hypothetical protein
VRETTESANAEDARIIELFVEKRAVYDSSAVLRLTGVTADRLERAVTDGEVEPIPDAGVLAFAWEDVAFLALERWTAGRIARTLAHAGRTHALPYFNQVRTISVELPLYQIRLLHYLAKMRSEGRPPLTVSDVLECELDALASEMEPAVIDREIAGFEAAVYFPSFEDRPQVVDIRCVFCGKTIDGGQDACAPCAERHVPANDGRARVDPDDDDHRN